MFPSPCVLLSTRNSDAQGMLATGMLLKGFFYGYYGVWVLFYPCMFAVCCILYMISRKVYLEEFDWRARPVDDDGTSGSGSSSSSSRGLDTIHSSLGNALLLPGENGGHEGGAFAGSDAAVVAAS